MNETIVAVTCNKTIANTLKNLLVDFNVETMDNPSGAFETLRHSPPNLLIIAFDEDAAGALQLSKNILDIDSSTFVILLASHVSDTVGNFAMENETVFVLPASPGKELPILITKLFAFRDMILSYSSQNVPPDTVQSTRDSQMMDLGVLVSLIGHELNNPLTTILWHSEQLLDKLNNFAPLSDDLTVMNNEVHRAIRIVKSLVSFSRHESMTNDLVEVNALVNATLNLFREKLLHRNISIEFSSSTVPLHVWGNFDCLQQALSNVIANAIHSLSCAENPRRLSVENTAIAFNKICIKISDSGPGIPRHLLNKIFQPFCTTKKAQGGTGLGLYFASQIIRKHNGFISARNLSPTGAMFTITLPHYCPASPTL